MKCDTPLFTASVDKKAEPHFSTFWVYSMTGLAVLKVVKVVNAFSRVRRSSLEIKLALQRLVFLAQNRSRVFHPAVVDIHDQVQCFRV